MSVQHRITRAGLHGAVAGLEIGQRVPSADFDLSAQLGTEIEGPAGSRFRLVKLNFSGGFGSGSGADSAARKVFNYVDKWLFTVEPSNAATDRPCGISASNQVNLTDGDYFWLQFRGRAEVIHSDDVGAPIAAADHVTADNDADRGKVITATTTFTHGVTVGMSMGRTYDAAGVADAAAGTASNANDEVLSVNLLYDLVG